MRHPLTAVLLSLPILATPAQAQVLLGSGSVSTSIEVVFPDVTVVGTQNLDFGPQTRGSVVRSSDVPTVAAWTITSDRGGNFSFVFQLPTALTGPEGSVPITFGSTSAFMSTSLGGSTVWDPNLPLGMGFGTPFTADVELGGDSLGDDLGDAIVDLSGASNGVYTGTIVLEVWLDE